MQYTHARKRLVVRVRVRVRVRVGNMHLWCCCVYTRNDLCIHNSILVYTQDICVYTNDVLVYTPWTLCIHKWCFGVYTNPARVYTYRISNGIDAPGPVRDRNNPKGLNHLTPLQQTELDNANQLVERSIEIARAITKNGGSVLFENPVDRGNKTTTDTNTKDRYEHRYKNHAPYGTTPP